MPETSTREIIAEDGTQRQHGPLLQHLLKTTVGVVRIASPYITDSRINSIIKNRNLQFLTSISILDIVSGAISLSALRDLINIGAECRHLIIDEKFHAKVIIFGDAAALVTSANFTSSGLYNNIEVGVQLTGNHVKFLTKWFNKFWEEAYPITETTLISLEEQTEELRYKFDLIKRDPRIQRRFNYNESLDILRGSSRFFCCNTNRKNGSSYEINMHERGYAAAWEDFKYIGHIQKVKAGDLILMYAKRTGIVGIGRAKGVGQVLEADAEDRIEQGNTREWRVPVDWLVWWQDQDACHFPEAKNNTFLDITQSNYAFIQNRVLEHFVGWQNAKKAKAEDDLLEEMRSSTQVYVRLRAKQLGKSKVGSRVYQMLSRHGAVETLSRLVHRQTDGLKFLKSIDKLYLSAEKIALDPKYESIICEQVRSQARANLRKLE